MHLPRIILLASLAGPAFAADIAAPDFKQLPPPPVLEDNSQDADLEPQVTITQKKDVVIEEYRVGGKLYKIKVTPKIGPPYYLVDERGDGEFSRRDGPDASSLRPPQWIIHEF